MAKSGWQQYLDISGISEERKQEVAQTLDDIWNTDSGKKVIQEAYATNKNTPVTITTAFTKFKHDDGQPISATSRQLHKPGQSEITLDFSKVDFEHNGHHHPLTLDRVLRHELHHIAHEPDDLAKRMKPHLYSHVREKGGLDGADIDKLKELGVLKQKDAEDYKEKIGNGEYVGLATVEGDGHKISTEQQNQFAEHVLSKDTQAIRDLIGDTKIDKSVIESLLKGGVESRIGAITVKQADALLERMDKGETITFADLEKSVGPLSYPHLATYVANWGSIVTQLPEADQQKLEKHLGNIGGMVTAWEDSQRAHEESTVGYVDRTTDGPDRGNYGNAIVKGGDDGFGAMQSETIGEDGHMDERMPSPPGSASHSP